MLLIAAEEISRLLPMKQAISLMRDAYRIISEGSASLAHRQALPLPGATGLLMGAASEGIGLGCKLVSIVPDNQARGLPGSIGLVLLLDDRSGEPLALIEGARLTALRTAALNGCAMDLLARQDARTGLLVGCGTQAAAQAEAMAAVRDLRELRILGREAGHTRRFADRLCESMSVTLRVVEHPEDALDGVDVVTAATNSLKPVLPGERIPDGCHVSGIGSFRPDMREFDEALLRRADIFVESRTTALAEAGELIGAHESGLSRAEQWSELGEVIDGRKPGRVERKQVTFFKSVGHAVFDLVAARAVYDRALAKGAGKAWRP